MAVIAIDNWLKLNARNSPLYSLQKPNALTMCERSWTRHDYGESAAALWHWLCQKNFEFKWGNTRVFENKMSAGRKNSENERFL